MDMAGNVLEWCLNEYDTPTNYQLSGNEARVLRGGSWLNGPGYVRASKRFSSPPNNCFNNLGFRVLCLSPIE